MWSLQPSLKIMTMSSKIISDTVQLDATGALAAMRCYAMRCYATLCDAMWLFNGLEYFESSHGVTTGLSKRFHKCQGQVTFIHASSWLGDMKLNSTIKWSLVKTTLLLIRVGGPFGEFQGNALVTSTGCCMLRARTLHG